MKVIRTAFLTTILALFFCIQTSADIIVTELMYNPADSGDAGFEWVEIYNSGPDPVDLTGWRLDDEDTSDWDPMTGILGPGQVGVITQVSEVDFKASWPSAVDAVIFTSGGDWTMANTGSLTNEVMVLLDASNNPVDNINYGSYLLGDAFRELWPASTNGVSIYLLPGFISQADNDNGANWALSELGVHGAVNVVAGGIFVVEDLGSPGVVIVPEISTYSLVLGALALAALFVRRFRR